MKKRKPAMRSNRHKNLGSVLTVTFIVVMILLIVFVNSRRLSERRDELLKREAYLLEQIDKEEERKEDIEEQKKYRKTLEFIEEMAREKLGLVHKDEIIIEAED